MWWNAEAYADSLKRNGGAVGDRTPDLRNAIATLSQLSYGPVFRTGQGVAGGVEGRALDQARHPCKRGNHRIVQKNARVFSGCESSDQ